MMPAQNQTNTAPDHKWLIGPYGTLLEELDHARVYTARAQETLDEISEEAGARWDEHGNYELGDAAERWGVVLTDIESLVAALIGSVKAVLDDHMAGRGVYDPSTPTRFTPPREHP